MLANSVQEGARRRVFREALVGMEMDLAVRQRADELALLPDVRDQGGGIGIAQPALLVAAHGFRPRTFLQRTEIAGEAHLVFLGEILIAEQEDQMLVPSELDLAERRPIELPPQIDAADLGAERVGQLGHADRHDLLPGETPRYWLAVAGGRNSNAAASASDTGFSCGL
jgi:hypothetical protein